MLLSYRCTCSSSCFTVVLAPKDANRRSCSLWEEAVTSLSLLSKAVFKSRTQRSDWRRCSSNSCNCKIKVGIQSSQVSLYRGVSCCWRIQALHISAHSLYSKSCNHFKYIQTFSSTSKGTQTVLLHHPLYWPLPSLHWFPISTVLSTDTAPAALSVACDTLCIHLSAPPWKQELEKFLLLLKWTHSSLIRRFKMISVSELWGLYTSVFVRTLQKEVPTSESSLQFTCKKAA